MNAQGRPVIQDLVRMSMEKSASRAQIAAEGSRQLQRSGQTESNTKEASAQDADCTTDFAEKLASAVEYIIPEVLKQAAIKLPKPNAKELPDGVSQTIDGKNPLGTPAALGHSRQHTIPLHAPMEHEGKMKTDMHEAPGLHTHGQPTSLQAGRGKTAEELEKEAAKKHDAALRALGVANQVHQTGVNAGKAVGRAARSAADKVTSTRAGKAVTEALGKADRKTKPAREILSGSRGRAHREGAAASRQLSHKDSGRAAGLLDHLAKKHERHTLKARAGVGAAGAAVGAGGAAAYHHSKKKEAFDMSSVSNFASGLAKKAPGALNRGKELITGSAAKHLAGEASTAREGLNKALTTRAAMRAGGVSQTNNIGRSILKGSRGEISGAAKGVRAAEGAANAEKLKSNLARAGAGAVGVGVLGAGISKATHNDKTAADRAFGRAISSMSDRGRKAGVAAWEAGKGAGHAVKRQAVKARRSVINKAEAAGAAVKNKANAAGNFVKRKGEAAGNAVKNTARDAHGGRTRELRNETSKVRDFVSKGTRDKLDGRVGAAEKRTRDARLRVGAGAAAGAAAGGGAAAIHHRNKKAEDALNPARISAGRAVPPDSSDSTQRPKRVDGPTEYMDSVEKAINFTKRDAYGKIKKDNLPYWHEKMMNQSADPVLHEAFKHTRQAGAKIASPELVSKTAAARSLLAELASQVGE